MLDVFCHVYFRTLRKLFFSTSGDKSLKCLHNACRTWSHQSNYKIIWHVIGVILYLCASEAFYFAVLNTCRSFADIHRVVKEGLIFDGKLLWPLPNCWEKHSRVFSLRDGFVFGKVLKSRENRVFTHCIINTILHNKMQCYCFFFFEWVALW